MANEIPGVIRRCSRVLHGSYKNGESTSVHVAIETQSADGRSEVATYNLATGIPDYSLVEVNDRVEVTFGVNQYHQKYLATFKICWMNQLQGDELKRLANTPLSGRILRRAESVLGSYLNSCTTQIHLAIEVFMKGEKIGRILPISGSAAFVELPLVNVDDTVNFEYSLDQSARIAYLKKLSIDWERSQR